MGLFEAGRAGLQRVLHAIIPATTDGTAIQDMPQPSSVTISSGRQKRAAPFADDEDTTSSTESKRAKATLPGDIYNKKNGRYDPGIPMTGEELDAWRTEARRARNRASAAASRKRTRDRIEELESEVTTIKSKYSEVLQRIIKLEQDPIRLAEAIAEMNRITELEHLTTER